MYRQASREYTISRVIVAWLYGKFTMRTASIGVPAALTFKFENNFRVEIRLKLHVQIPRPPARQDIRLFATHGDTLKPQSAVEFVASQYLGRLWGDTRKRYAKFVPRPPFAKRRVRQRQLIRESFETLAAKDARHAAHGYQSYSAA